MFFLILTGVFLQSACKNQIFVPSSLGFEQLDNNRTPKDWDIKFDGVSPISEKILDSVNKIEGKYSLLFNFKEYKYNYGVCKYSLPVNFYGKKIKITGYIMSDLDSGSVGGLWITSLGEGGQPLAQKHMKDNSIKHKTKWTKYDLELDINTGITNEISFGAFLHGTGKLWIDDIQIYIDDIPLDKIEKTASNVEHRNTLDDKYSKINMRDLTIEQIDYLYEFGVVWGFLKYHHPNVKNGKLDWDSSLFSIMPKILCCKSNEDKNKLLDDFIIHLDLNYKQQKFNNKLVKNYFCDTLFRKCKLSKHQFEYLAYIRNSCSSTQGYYLSLTQEGTPHFINEIKYKNNLYPEDVLRLLALFRYWNIINYYYVYKFDDWDNVLKEFIPKFILAKNSTEYQLICLELVSLIHDTHAIITTEDNTLNSVKGKFILPFKAKFIQGFLTVTDYYNDSDSVKKVVNTGDIIKKINGITTDSLIRKFKKITPSSNIASLLRELSSSDGFLLRSKDSLFEIDILSGKKLKRIHLVGIPFYSAKSVEKEIKNGFRLLSTEIGYIYPEKLREGDIDSIQYIFNNTKGLIIDFRCYPSLFMPYVYGDWLKQKSSPFVKFMTPDFSKPGKFNWSAPLTNGGGKTIYKGNKIVILVNENTQSAAEYDVMAFQGESRVMVIGSMTAGADGNVSSIILPGGITTFISGIGVYYPNNTVTQRVGIKIDKIIKPTVKGIRKGEDELLIEAIKIIKQS